MPPTVISHYRVVRRLGAGGMGEVFLAEDTRLERSVALKLLPKAVAEDASRRKRFLAEAKAASALNHPNVCTIHEVGETADGQPYIAMEYLEGQTLEALARHRRLELREIVGIGVQVADALEAARQSQVVHRDIKPGNIIVQDQKAESGKQKSDSQLRVKVVDFGLAKRLDQAGEAPTLTREGAIVGTPNYLSPDLALGREVDSRSDIFSLGVVLYELAARQNPFAGASFGETVNNILNKSPEPLKPWNPTVTAEFERIVFKCLEKDVAKRYATPAQLRDDLAKLQESWQAPRSSSQRIWAVAAIILVLGVIGLGALWLTRARPAPPPPSPGRNLTTVPQKSVAVLPFVNMSSDKADEYLSDGMTEELLNALARIPELRVPGRSSSLAFKGRNEEGIFRKVGEQLRVQTVLEGSVRKAGEKLRVTAQLINVQDGFHLWSDTYDRDMTNIFAIESDIAARVAAALKVQLLGASREPTANIEAYKLYLQGRNLWNRRTGDAIKQAIEVFNRAIAKDPAYAQAYAGLADCYAIISEFAGLPQRETLPKAQAAALKALELDSTLAEPHAVLGSVRFDAWDWAGAEQEYQKAIALNPKYATAHHWYGISLLTHGHLDKALEQLRLAQEADPLSPVINLALAEFTYRNGRRAEGIKMLENLVEVEPDFQPARTTLGELYVLERRPAEAIAQYQAARPRSGNEPYWMLTLGYAYALAGRTNEAQQVLLQLREFQAQGHDIWVPIAWTQYALGDVDGALDTLERAFLEHAERLEFLNWDPTWDGLRPHPRVQAILRKMNLAAAPAANLDTPDPKSVAVLPFVNMSADKADEYLSDGISEEIITALSKVKGLKVPARTSCFVFKGKNEDIQKIGQQLHVATVLEGSISKTGNKVRVTAQLINIADGFHVWSETYDRNLDDLLAIRTEVAARVAEALKGQLLGEDRQQLAKRGTENAEAYRLYLQARYLWNRRTPEDVKQAIQYFNQALGKDAGYALAYAGLADCYAVLPFYTGLPRRDALPKARAAALKALELDSSLAEPHATLAAFKAGLDWDWSGAEVEFRQAIALNPNYATARFWFAEFLDALGRHDEALAETRRALEIDPLSRIFNASLGFQLFLTGKADAGIDVLRKQIAFDPSFVVAHGNLGWIHYHQGRFSEAIAEFETMHRFDGSGVFALDGLGSAYARAGRTNDAQRILYQVEELQRQGIDYRVGIALIQYTLGDSESALDSLEKGVTERAMGVEGLYCDSIWKDLRPHPRVQAILRKMDLVK